VPVSWAFNVHGEEMRHRRFGRVVFRWSLSLEQALPCRFGAVGELLDEASGSEADDGIAAITDAGAAEISPDRAIAKAAERDDEHDRGVGGEAGAHLLGLHQVLQQQMNPKRPSGNGPPSDSHQIPP
jgi:hypothetical protein